MKNIRSRYQLINGFKKQDRQSIWRHLDTLSNDPTVYSEQLAGIGPHLSDGRLYIYIDHSWFAWTTAATRTSWPTKRNSVTERPAISRQTAAASVPSGSFPRP